MPPLATVNQQHGRSAMMCGYIIFTLVDQTFRRLRDNTLDIAWWELGGQ
jgi:hypothetical protein